MTSDTVKYNGTQVLSASYTYDDKDNITNKLYAYKCDGDETTVDLINQYDDEGRITATGIDNYHIYYTYDSNGQLSRVDDGYTNSSTTVYSYDSRGNITAKNVYPFTRNETITSSPTETKTFTYANFGWKDLLVAVDDVELTYDEIGNVLSFGNRSFTWNSGRNLASITDGSNTYSYKYDENGIRTSKTVNGVTTYYNTKNGVILSQSDGTNTMYFRYDTSGTPLGFIFNGVQYFYMTNQMGDVIAILDINGNLISEYVYDEWGKLLGTFCVDENNAQQVAATNTNPLRYRGYYYDIETGYYYLQSRYYDPGICRFINADIPEIAQMSKDISVTNNLFAYCDNDPVNNSDPTGYWAQNYYGFSRNDVGFNVYVQLAFLSRYFCLSYANDVIKLYGQRYWWGKGYKNMSAVRIAQELWFHALVYYVGYPMKWALNKLNVSWNWLNQKVKQARYMEINNDDDRAWVFALTWWSAYAVRTYIRYMIGFGFPWSYIHI